ncbi:MAG: DUF992 domain-containing protein [Xanthobacteraceae bacterium]|jgi:hypothetical protein
MRFTALFGIAAAMLVASFASANAQQSVQAGILECQGAEYVGAIVGSTTELECVFRNDSGAPAEPYIAHISRVGLDIGVTAQTGLAWAVNAPTVRLGHGALAGHYSGVGANATVGVGIGANLLVGGSANAISLQPLSLQGQTGLSAVAGIIDVELRSPTWGERRGFHRHHRHHYHYHRRHHHG